MTITAQLVRDLREQTGAGMMDCKKALEASSGSLEAAIDHLRKSGLEKADKKASRSMGEGRVAFCIADDGRSGALVAVTCETDFVARTDEFTSFLEAVVGLVLTTAPASVEDFLGQDWPSGGSVEEALKGCIGSLGENMRIADCRQMACQEGWVGSYLHHDGMQAALVSVATGADREAAAPLLKGVCQQIVVHSAPYLSRDDVPAEIIEREQEIHRAALGNKPPEIQEKILSGKLEKYYAGNCLAEQAWIHDDKQSVTAALESALGEGARIAAFAGFRVGS